MTSARVTTAVQDGVTERTFALEGGASGSTYIGAGIAIAVEAALWHLYLMTHSQVLAWLSTSFNAAILIWGWGAYRAQSHPLIRVDDSHVEVIFGNRWRFPRSSIASVTTATWRSVPDAATDYLTYAKPLEPNVTIVLEKPARVRMALGISKRVSRVDLRVANPDALVAALTGPSHRP